MKFLRTAFLLLCVTGTALANDMPPPAGNDGPPPAMGGNPGDGPPRGHHRPGPPPEALAACKGLSIGAKTSMKAPDGNTHSGSCQLVFVPDRKGGDAPPPPQPPQQRSGEGAPAGW